MHKLVTVANPAAGTDFSHTVPTGKYWVIRAGSFIFTSDATAATRNVRIQLDDGANAFFIGDTDVGQTASLAIRYTFFQGSVTTNAGAATSTPRIVSFPSLIMLPGNRFRSIVSGIQATDAFTVIHLWVDEREGEYDSLQHGNLTPWAL